MFPLYTLQSFFGSLPINKFTIFFHWTKKFGKAKEQRECIFKNVAEAYLEPSTMELFSKIVNGFDWVLNTPLCYSKLFLPYTPIAHRYFTQKSMTLHKTAGKGLFFTFPDFYGVLYLSIYLLVDSLLACFILNNKSISFLVKTGNTLGTTMYFVKSSGIHVWCMCEVFMCIYCIFNMCVWYMCGICVYIYIFNVWS